MNMKDSVNIYKKEITQKNQTKFRNEFLNVSGIFGTNFHKNFGHVSYGFVTCVVRQSVMVELILC